MHTSLLIKVKSGNTEQSDLSINVLKNISSRNSRKYATCEHNNSSKNHILHALLKTRNPKTGSLSNSEDIDKMPHNAAFHQDLQYLLRQNRSTDKQLQ